MSPRAGPPQLPHPCDWQRPRPPQGWEEVIRIASADATPREPGGESEPAWSPLATPRPNPMPSHRAQAQALAHAAAAVARMRAAASTPRIDEAEEPETETTEGEESERELKGRQNPEEPEEAGPPRNPRGNMGRKTDITAIITNESSLPLPESKTSTGLLPARWGLAFTT